MDFHVGDEERGLMFGKTLILSVPMQYGCILILMKQTPPISAPAVKDSSLSIFAPLS